MASSGSHNYLDSEPPRATHGTGYSYLRAAPGGSVPMNARTVSYDDKPRDDEAGRTQVFVGNLPYRVRWQDLKDLFRNAGPHHLNILRADVTLLPDNRSKGSGTVLFSSREDALRAIEAYHGYNWQGRVLDVHLDTQDPTGANAIANAQHPNHGNQIIGIPMMHFMSQQGPGSAWSSPIGQSASLPGVSKSNFSNSVSPPSSSRPSSASGHRNATPATSPGEQTSTSTSEPPVSIAITTASGATIQMPAGFPQNAVMVPVPVMMPHGANNGGAQMFAMPQFFQPGNFMYYTPQGFRPNAAVPPGYQNRHLFVGNLPFNCQWQDLKDLFRTAGNILRADITTGPDGRSRGFGTVLFGTTEDAQNAVRMFNGYEYNGRALKVHFDKFAGQQHPSQGIQGQPPLHHRSSAPVLPTAGVAPPLLASNSTDFVPQMNGMHFDSTGKRRDGSHHSAIPANEEANRPPYSRQSASAPHMPSIHGAIHPPHAMAYSAAPEPTQILGPAALMSPGPAQTGDMQAFAAAAAHYADHQRQFGPPMGHRASHLRQSTTAEDEHDDGEHHGEEGGYATWPSHAQPTRTPDNEHPGPLQVQIPPPPFFGPISPQQARGVPMTPSMPGFSFHPFPQTPPPMMPHFLSPGLGPFSPPLGHTPPAAYAAPGMPMHFGMTTPTAGEAPGFGPGYFPSMGSVMAGGHPIMEAMGEGEIPSSSSSETEGTVVEAPTAAANEERPAESPAATIATTTTTNSSDKSSTGKSYLEGSAIFRESALAARRASHHSVRSRADANLGLLPSALEPGSSPLLHSSSPGSGPRTEGSDDLAHKVSRLELGPSYEDAQQPRRASFLDGALPSSPVSAEFRRRIDAEDIEGPPRRSSFDGSAPENKAKLKRFGAASIWQV